MFTFDFETHAIGPRPDYPPQPVGVALANGKTKPNYLAWGHPTGNTSVDALGREALRKHWGEALLCHHAAFDIAVAHERLGLPLPDGTQVHDTMFLAFLLDPYGDLSLKPLAERYLGMPPEERDAVRDYLYTHKVVRKNLKGWGAFISQAPGDIVGPYACGDVTRTKLLHEHLLPLVVEQGMYEAYRRECLLVPMLLANSRDGIPLDRERLERDTLKYEQLLGIVDTSLLVNWKRDIGTVAPGNFNAPDEIAAALSGNREIKLPRTPTGKLSTAKAAIMEALPNCKTKGLLLYRSALEQSLSTYMRPWLTQGAAIHCNWNQVRDYSDRGARTGRLSSSPNLQNTTNPEKYEDLHRLMRDCGLSPPEFPLPNLRSYIVAPPGMVLFSRDYSQQEFRMLAHYEDGPIAQAYRDDPDTDMHVFAMNLINDTTHIGITRKPTKTINFGKTYGMGVPKLAHDLRLPLEEAQKLVYAYNVALPSVGQLMRDVCAVGKNGDYITTIGGRRYYSPPADTDEFDRTRTYEYKLLNYLMQGGSADQTKEAMVRWWRGRLHDRSDTRFLMTIHDQLVGVAPYEDVLHESAILDDYMVNAFTLDVPTKTDPTYGFNFGEMTTKLPKQLKKTTRRRK